MRRRVLTTHEILICADRLDEALPRIEAAPAAFLSVEVFGEALLAGLPRDAGRVA